METTIVHGLASFPYLEDNYLNSKYCYLLTSISSALADPRLVAALAYTENIQEIRLTL